VIFRENNKVQNGIIRKMEGYRRLKIAFGLNEFARKMIRANIRKNKPGIKDAELDKLVADKFRIWSQEEDSDKIWEKIKSEQEER